MGRPHREYKSEFFSSGAKYVPKEPPIREHWSNQYSDTLVLLEERLINHIIAEMKDGERPIVSVTNEQGEESKMMVRAMPRYGNLNFYNLDGQVQKREQFLKKPKQELGQGNSVSKKQGQEKEQGQSIVGWHERLKRI